jgi:S-adenosylmethionine:tRNA ribosyltransferase-isomerase
VYADENGAVAAPTAGLHFSPELIKQLEHAGIKFAYVTLHVGMGTFKPVTVDDLDEHKMHSEVFKIDQTNAELINNTKKEGGRVIAVGTTSVRTLETAGKSGELSATKGSTELFIQPGFEFKIIDGMITNFHLPRSTLLALVGAFAGMDNIRAAYEHAVRNRYRFFSYGDAMLIL